MDVIELFLKDRKQTYFEIALVDKPAIESELMMFSKEDIFQFKEVEGEEGLLMGYFMIADMKIPRYDEKRNLYFEVKFTKQAIDTIIENFQINGLANKMNLQHNTGQYLPGVFVRNHWQIDSEKGILPPKGFKVEADGSWFGVVKCESEEIKEKVRQGLINGFSIESQFIQKEIDKYFESKQSQVEEVIKSKYLPKSTMKKLYNKFQDMNINLKEAYDAFVAYFSKEENTHKFEELLLADGVTKVVIEPAVEVGAAIAVLDAEGQPIPAPVGEHELQDGRKVLVEVEGVIAAITEATAGGEEMQDEPAKDTTKENAAVKRMIERIEKVSEFEKQIEDLKAEKDALKKETEFLHKENDELKNQFSELKQFTQETFSKILGEESKEPAQKQHKGFAFEKKESPNYKFLNNKF